MIHWDRTTVSYCSARGKFVNIDRNSISHLKKGVLALIRKVGMLIRKYVSTPMIILIKKLNETLRCWANYHRHVVSSEVFSRVDNYVYEQL